MSRLSLGPFHGFKRDPQPSPTHATFGLPHLVSQTWLLPTLRLGHLLAMPKETEKKQRKKKKIEEQRKLGITTTSSLEHQTQSLRMKKNNLECQKTTPRHGKTQKKAKPKRGALLGMLST
ncbi:hypothetical protein PIB30_066679 [Stylosanthes scabra]|uniref:Uncharacterized protein n=1 Tax=Stylosanthes scabra TaxID=79078 RepID=A0ABU6QMB8_9FABA|nr:hypothetical protein [Stylosanthes scabra]